MIYLKLVLTAVFWGGTFIAGKSLAGNVHPLDAALLRFVIASAFLLALTWRKFGRLPGISPRQILPIVLLGATGVFSYNVLFFSGLQYITAGKASLIVANNPIIISLLSALIFKERLTRIKGAGILMSVTGALIVISGGHITDAVSYHLGKGELMIAGCVASWVAYSLIGKSVMGQLSPMVSVCYSSVAGAVLLAVPVLAKGNVAAWTHYSVTAWSSLFYLGFFGTVLGFFWYYEGIQALGAMKASVFINVVPVSAICLAYFLLGETVTPSLFTGGLLVIAGVYATNASEVIGQGLKRIRERLFMAKETPDAR
ncbi:MAG: EamA family transporter [Pseudomonadota bacterium]